MLVKPFLRNGNFFFEGESSQWYRINGDTFLWDLSRSETSSNFFTLSDWYWMEITYRKHTHIRLYLCHPYSNHYSKYTQFQSFRRVSGHERLLSSAFQPSNDSHYSHYAMILWLSYPSECVQNALVTWHSS